MPKVKNIKARLSQKKGKTFRDGNPKASRNAKSKEDNISRVAVPRPQVQSSCNTGSSKTTQDSHSSESDEIFEHPLAPKVRRIKKNNHEYDFEIVTPATQMSSIKIHGYNNAADVTNFEDIDSPSNKPEAQSVDTITDAQHHRDIDGFLIPISYLRNNILPHTSMLTGESINVFTQIFKNQTNYDPISTSCILYPNRIQPITRGQKDIQIVGGIPEFVHWHTLYHDNNNILHIYDSYRVLTPNGVHSLPDREHVFIKKRYPHLGRSDIVFEQCQQQPDGAVCGVFSAANAITLALDENPNEMSYLLDSENVIQNVERMRKHLLQIIETGSIIRFGTANLTTNPVAITKSIFVPSSDKTPITNDYVELNDLEDIVLPNTQTIVENEARVQHENQLSCILQSIERERSRNNQISSYLRGINRRAEPINIGLMDSECEHCNALHFLIEINSKRKYTKCCHDGKVQLPPLEDYPQYLQSLFKGEHVHSAHFKRYVLQYNYAYQFVSMQAELRNYPNRGPQVYSILGKVYHRISNVNVVNPAPKFGPVYFLEPHAAILRRLANNRQEILKPNIIQEIENIMREINPFAAGYTTLREMYNTEINNNVQMPNVVLELISVRGNRNFDLPTINEVAAVYVANDQLPPTPNLRIYLRDQPDVFHTLNSIDERIDPLTFPLLFPRGEFGWNSNIPQTVGNRRVTLCQFYSYRLSYRRDNKHQYERFKYAGKLSQQYIVASYIKVEANNLNFIKYNQNRLRAEQYQGLADYVHQHQIDNQAETIGRMVILPSSFVGSPRYQMQLFQDAMAIHSKFGQPSLFITFTCNPKWLEIINNIPPKDDPMNHPMLVARVFQARLKEFIKEILKNHIFGVPLAQVHVIEFQKRGLPHAHILLILRREDKLGDPLRIEQLISAEIPNRALEPELYNLVATHMIHGPCGKDYPNAPCMVDGKCSKKYPKPFSKHTFVNPNGDVTYKRPNNGRLIKTVRNNEVFFADNTWIVPHNPYTLFRYNAHVNFEACATVHAVKYIFKYIFKGSDRALLHITVDNAVNYDECEAYVSSRYMSPPEAAYHLNQFPLHEMTHVVYRLPVHLPHRQIVHFQQGFEQEAIQINEITQLTDWFRLNQEDIDARQYRYPDIPLHYVWRTPARRWVRRLRGAENMVSRMYNVSLHNTEQYYLRLLLLHVKGATSFEDIRTVNDTIHETFLKACRDRGLLEDDLEWHRALNEAKEKSMPKLMRRLFSHILCFGTVSDPIYLWQTYKDSMTEDFTHHGQKSNIAEQNTLKFIQSVLIRNGRRLSEFSLPEPHERIIFEEDIVNPPEEQQLGEVFRRQLNMAQIDVFNRVMAAVEDDNLQPRLFALDGCAGSGKTFLFNTLITVLNGRQIPVISVSWSGLSASIIKGGRTIHSRFKLAVPITENSTSNIRPNSEDGQRIKNTKLIIIDEISMVPRLALEAIDRVLKDICGSPRPLGGKVVLLSGDFRQTLPILMNAYRSQITAETVKESYLWNSFTPLRLEINMRAGPNEQEFSNWLLHLGNNTLPKPANVTGSNLIQIPPQCVVNSKKRLIELCFPDLHLGSIPNAAILTPLNEDCNEINNIILDNLEGEIVNYYSADSINYENDEIAEAANYSIEFLNSLTPSGLPPHCLQLKVGIVVMLLRNMNSDQNLCNGTRLLIRNLGERIIEAQRIDLDGNLTNQTFLIPRIDMTPINTTLPFKLRRRQFPLKVCYAMTINKSQGQTFEKIGIYLNLPVFAHGQLYTAFSRTRSFNSVYVFVEDSPSQGRLILNSNDVFTRNLVYPEVL